MLTLNVTLSYYKRPEIRQAMAEQCRGKEIAIKFTDHFGKRPSTIIYDKDILSFAQKKATSFHISEETWSNPMQLNTTMRRPELNELRVGWDLILDVDFPIWEATKTITAALIEQLRKEGIPDEAITLKFSGNKGFHIAVPYEAFPATYVDDKGEEILMSDLFPEGVKTIVEYLVHELDGPHNNFALSEQLVNDLGLENLKELLMDVDAETGAKAKAESVAGNEFSCSRCGWHGRSHEDYMNCPSPGCNALLTPIKMDKETRKTRKKLDLAIDTMLVSSRHMYRLVYSLHEKSGLASIPIPLDELMSFEKEQAKPEKVNTSLKFLDRNVPNNCASSLLQRAMKFKPPGEEERKEFSQVEWEGDAAPEELFPPAIKKMLGPLTDGRKRALFVLTNFLRSVGWSNEMIEARLREWNDSQEDPLRPTTIEGHLRHHLAKKDKVLPPNFDNDMYYKDMGVLVHDELSERVKNPVQYVRLKKKQQGKD